MLSPFSQRNWLAIGDKYLKLFLVLWIKGNITSITVLKILLQSITVVKQRKSLRNKLLK